MRRILPDEVVASMRAHDLYPERGLWASWSSIKIKGGRFRRRCMACGLTMAFFEWDRLRPKPPQSSGWKLEWSASSAASYGDYSRFAADLGLDYYYAANFARGWDGAWANWCPVGGKEELSLLGLFDGRDCYRAARKAVFEMELAG